MKSEVKCLQLKVCKLWKGVVIFMKRKSFIALMLASSFIITSIPVHVNAMSTVVAEAVTGESVQNNSKEDTKLQVNLSKIITEVKKKVTIPSDCTKFESDYYGEEYGRGIQWNLRWYSEKGSHYFNVVCDDSANITYINDRDYDKYDEKEPINYLIKELRPVADAFIKKVAPDVWGHVTYQNATYVGYYNNCYQFEYVRTENGIMMPDNTITIQISAADKKVKQYNANWLFGLSIPSKEVKISKEQATEKIKKQVTMELKYLTKWSEDGKTRSAYLVYAPNNNYIAVDAKTGEVYTSREQWIESSKNESAMQDTAENQSNAGASSLTKEELAQIKELGSLITKEQAIEKVVNNKYLLMDANMKAITATLSGYRMYGNENVKQYVWGISLTDPRPSDDSKNDYYRASAYATVDAKTGEILSFHSSVKNADQMTTDELEKAKTKFSKEECAKIYEAFAKSQNEKQFVNTKQSSVIPDYIYDYVKEIPVYGGYTFGYQRVNEGIPYADNYFSGSVDSISGKVFEYRKNWDTAIKFESPKNAMSPEQAFNAYIKLDGYELVYEINTVHKLVKGGDVNANIENSYSMEYQPRLVYRTNINPNTISPFTGKQLDWAGNVYAPESKKSADYTDIKGHAYERSILLLRDLGAGTGELKFRPNDVITGKELQSLAEKLFYEASRDEIKLKSNSGITKQQLAKYTVQILGYEKVATMGDIFLCGYTDDAKIGKDYYNYVAIAKALKLFGNGKEKSFQPTAKITRGEAADILIKVLNSSSR